MQTSVQDDEAAAAAGAADASVPGRALPLRSLSLRRPGRFGLAVAGVSAWAVFANFFRIGHPARGYDEPFYSLAGWRYVHGSTGALPTRGLTSFDNFEHPPLAKYLFGVAQLVAGHPSVVADRVVAALCTLGTAAVLGLWLGRVAGRWIGLGAAALVGVLPMSVSTVPFRFGRYGYLDPVAELFAVASLALAWEWFRRDERAAWPWAIATGAGVGLATASKENAFLGVGGAVLLGLALAARDRRAALARSLQALAAVGTSGAVFLLTYTGLTAPFPALRFMIHYQHLHATSGHRVQFAGRTSTHPPGWAFLWFAAHGVGALAALACVVCAVAAVVLRRDRLVAWLLAALAGPLIFHMLLAHVILPFYWVMWMPAFLGLVALGAAALVSSGRGAFPHVRETVLPVAGVTCVAVLVAASAHDTAHLIAAGESARGGPPYAQTVETLHPLVYLRLDERDGATAADASGHGRTGTYVGSPALRTAGLLTGDANRSVTFAGSAQHVTIRGGSWADVADYSVAVWFRTSGRSAYLASLDDFRHAKAWDLVIDPTGHLRYVTYRPFTGVGQPVVSAQRVDDGERHLAVCTKAGRLVRLFVDGRLVASALYAGFARATPTLPIELGRRGSGDGSFAGTLDEFAYFGAPLGMADVAALYRSGTAR